MECIEEWSTLAKMTFRRFGDASSLCELTASILKTVKNRKANSPYAKKVLNNAPRFFKIGRIMPKNLKGVICIEAIVQDEFFHNITSNPEFETNANISMLRKAFPKTLQAVQKNLESSILCLEDLD